ncbi:MAG: ATP-binding protein [Pseudonocardiaceae bacterium]
MTHLAVAWPLVELLRDGENSGVEFTRDDVQPHDLAKELVALSNLRGGRILLGVEDDGSVSGLVRDAVEEWVLTIARDTVRPPLIPHVQIVTDPASGRRVAVVTVEAGYAVHAMWHNKHFAYYIRAGRQSREASPEELSRLQQQRGGFRAELRPISGTSYADLDQRRLTDYFQRVRGQDVPDQEDRQGWVQLLSATEFLVASVREPVPCLAAIALFASSTAHFLPQSGVDAVAYPGVAKNYAAIERATLRGPLAPLMTRSGELVEPGLVDSAVAFVRRNVGVRAELVDGVRRVEIPGLPAEPVREALVNAVIHRDYLLAHTDVELGLYPDRLEIVSPGRLPNGVTVERMLAGTRAARNEVLKDVMRDYGYLEHMGLGVPRKIVRGMREFNGSQPEFTVGEESLTVVLRR